MARQDAFANRIREPLNGPDEYTNQNRELHEPTAPIL
jgi:hypothetical protein